MKGSGGGEEEEKYDDIEEEYIEGDKNDDFEEDKDEDEEEEGVSYEYGAEEVEEVLEEIDDTKNILMIKELVKKLLFSE